MQIDYPVMVSQNISIQIPC